MKRKDIVEEDILAGILFYLKMQLMNGKITRGEYRRYARRFGLIEYKHLNRTKNLIRSRLAQGHYTPLPLP